MAKRRPPPKDAKPADAGPLNSPFAGLASLREQLPAGDAAVEADDAPVAAPPTPSTKVVVRHERKGRKGKTVTRISGVGDDAVEWARRMKRELGCGGSVEDGDIILAGNLVDRAARWLEDAGVTRVVRGS